MYRGMGFKVISLIVTAAFLVTSCATKNVRIEKDRMVKVRIEKGDFVTKKSESAEVSRTINITAMSPTSAKVYEDAEVEEHSTLYYEKLQIEEGYRLSNSYVIASLMLCPISPNCIFLSEADYNCRVYGRTYNNKVIIPESACIGYTSKKVFPNEYYEETKINTGHKKHPIPNAAIAVYIDGDFKTDIKTDEQGIAKIDDIGKYPIDLSGKDNIKIEFRYKDASAESEIPAAQYANAVKLVKERNIPSDLTASIKFTDEKGHTPNNRIDAVEESYINVEIKNKGEGIAYGVKLIAATDYKNIDVSKSIDIGNIMPGDSKKAEIRLKAGKELKGGDVPLLITLAEERGYDWKKKILLPASGLEMPGFAIDYEINDGSRGLAKGNGNGIPENGETIELTAFIKNQGEGDAVGVEMSAGRINEGITWEKKEERIGRIHPGETVKAKAAFSIPINFDAEKIIASLNLKDSRGVSSLQKDIELAYRKLSPELHYDYRIMSRGKEVSSVANGEEFRIGITVKNDGSLQARDVSMTLESGKDIRIDQKRIDLGIIEAQSPLPARDISFSIPRDYKETSVPVNVALSQSDFSGFRDVIKIPVAIRKPSLTYTASLLSRDGKSVQQGETADLEITVLNEGDLNAEDVSVSLGSNEDHLKILGEKYHKVGVVPEKYASETIKFRVSATKRIAGSIPLDIKIEQKDFSPVSDKYAMNVTEENIAVIDFTSGAAKELAVSTAKLPPAIKILSPKNGEVIEEESIYLAALVTDYRKLENVAVKVNGSNIPLNLSGMKRRDIRTYIPLSEGSNTIEISSYNADNLTSTETVTVTRKAEVNVDISPVINNSNPDAVGVVIGISHYRNASVPSVDYAARDAMAVKDYLVHAFGFNKRNVIEAFDSDATNAELRTIFEEKLAGYVKPGKTDLFIYYSGHGAPSTDTKKPYIVPYDADPAYIKTQGYLLEKLYGDIDKLNARSVTVVIDSCFSGQSEKGLIVTGISPIYLSYENPAMQIKNGVVFTSSTGDQVLSWFPQKRHGLFTYYFLLGLRGAADTDRDGRIAAKELGSYLSANVSEKARYINNREQTPTVVGDKEAVLLRY